MKQWLYLLKPVRPDMATNPTPEEMDAVERHFQRLKAMLDDGRLVLAGRTQEEVPFGIVIFEAETEAEARAIMEGDPAVQDGVMTATLHPYRVALLRGTWSAASPRSLEPILAKESVLGAHGASSYKQFCA